MEVVKDKGKQQYTEEDRKKWRAWKERKSEMEKEKDTFSFFEDTDGFKYFDNAILQFFMKNWESLKGVKMVQIGAHSGKVDKYWDPHVYLARKISNSGAKFLLIEPVPFHFHQLKANYASAVSGVDVSYLNKAVSDTNGKLSLTVLSDENQIDGLPEWLSTLSSANPKHFARHTKDTPWADAKLKQVEVECIPLGQLLAENNFTNFDILTVDTEGHDYNILMGYDWIVKPTYVFFESCHIDGPLVRGEKYQKLIKRFSELGYEIVMEDYHDTIVKLKEVN